LPPSTLRLLITERLSEFSWRAELFERAEIVANDGDFSPDGKRHVVGGTAQTAIAVVGH
jgi:hypothetical protein